MDWCSGAGAHCSLIVAVFRGAGSGGYGDLSASDRVGTSAYVDAEPLHHLRGELRRVLERYQVFVQFVQVQERPVAGTAAHICTV